MSINLEIGLGIGALGGGGGAAPVPPLPASGLISEWRFAEGSGNSVNDEVGANDINLALPTTPNFTWQPYGISLAAGLIQTPAITSCRTVAFLYRVGRGEAAGFEFSGGTAGSSDGAQGAYASATYTWLVGSGQGVAPLRKRSNGTFADRINRGGFILLFCEFNAAASNPFGFGGRYGLTSSRCADFEIMWAAAWSGQLTDQNRSDAYGYVRNLAKLRGKPIDWRDCSTFRNVVALWGQSNADGRAPISGLSGADQARTTPANSFILSASGSLGNSLIYPPASLTMGTNQQQTLPATDFGPEMGAAWLREDGGGATGLMFSKTAVGSTYLSPTSAGVATSGTSWNTAEPVESSLFQNALRNWYDLEQYYLSLGIGPRLRGLWWMQGEQDATNTTASAGYQASLQSLYDQAKLYTAVTGLQAVVARIRDQDPTFNPTAVAQVRAAQAAFVAANSGFATLIDTDSLALLGDLVHYNAAGMKSLGQAFYNATVLS